MGADEEGTLERLKAHRRQLIDPKIAEHRGRIVKTTGDGLLVEFASVVDAVRCAAEVQRGMLDREPELPDERRIRFRGPRNRARSIAVPHTRSVSGWPLDTNVVSAFGPERRPIPAHTAARFRARTEALYLSTISAAEIEGGIAKLRRTGSGRRADNLRQWFDRILTDYADRLLRFDLATPRIAGVLGDSAQAEGRHPGFADVAIAAIAKSRELVVVTVNLHHFDPIGVDTFNPFELG